MTSVIGKMIIQNVTTWKSVNMLLICQCLKIFFLKMVSCRTNFIEYFWLNFS